jgi:hypothetical protein
MTEGVTLFNEKYGGEMGKLCPICFRERGDDGEGGKNLQAAV